MRTVSILCLFCAVAPAQYSGTGAIAGTVVENSTAEPVRKAVVTLTLHGTPNAWATTRTDGVGGFRFDGLPAGVYDLRANRDGIGVAIYGANSYREIGENITLAAGQRRDGLKLRFVRSATISGSVTGPDGDSMFGAQVMLLRTGRNMGKPVLMNSRNARTDDRGEYRMPSVDPGQYYVFATMPGGQTPGVSTQAVAGQYYGGSRDSKDSTVLSIHDGDHVRGIDFRLIPEPAVQIHGRVIGVPQQPAPVDDHRPERAGTFAQHVGITIRNTSGAGIGFNQGAGANGPDYEFESSMMPPGEYRVQAIMRVDGKAYWASQRVDARAGSAEVILALAPSVDVIGQLRMEGPDRNTAIRVSLSEDLIDTDGGSLGDLYTVDFGAPVGADGRFTIAQLAPGRWNVNVYNLPRGAFVKAVRFGDQAARFQAIEIKPGSEAQLNIVVSTHAAKIAGQVDAAGLDPARAGILLAPSGELHEFPRFYYSEEADDHGKFRFLDIPPGKYRIFALERFTAKWLHNPESADQLNALFSEFAQEIELAEDGSMEARPKLIPLERVRAVMP
jgi:hypothetical protein